MNARVTVRLPFESKQVLLALVDALTPELQRQIGTRSKTTLKVDGDVLVLDVAAKDTIALRAALNAYLRWIQSTCKVLENLEHG